MFFLLAVPAAMAQGVGASHDAMGSYDRLPETVMRSAFPKWPYQHIPNDVLPALWCRGVSEDPIRTMMVENPSTARRPGYRVSS
jgi:predicted metal-dependent phosphotriesterase family hydrolase